ncbi:MAG: AbrB/MazE/SpoVT family DNA-binding domain-containing protein [Candidatus Brockarchaeota archaeon]|nr:AbrB/MazE/SpoVT family DNA-binding domain-containing protein [Candidatus Brockarchaeota archaeon]
MSSRVDEKGRVVIPRTVAKELGLNKGDELIFERRGKTFVIKRRGKGKGGLEALMDWNPERRGEPAPVSPAEMKKIWET